jgi:hypothetical protein
MHMIILPLLHSKQSIVLIGAMLQMESDLGDRSRLRHVTEAAPVVGFLVLDCPCYTDLGVGSSTE